VLELGSGWRDVVEREAEGRGSELLERQLQVHCIYRLGLKLIENRGGIEDEWALPRMKATMQERTGGP
jgi:hypothetical protein